MYKLIFTAVCCGLFLMPDTANAQYGHASTARESYLNGASRLVRNRGLYQEHLGRARVYNQEAYRQGIDNWKHYVETRRELKDSYKARNKPENALDRKERMLDQAERAHALKLREQKLRDEGILPPKKKGYLRHKGKKFHSIEEWKKSPEYALRKLENAARELQRQDDKRAAKARLQEAVDFGRMWSKMGFLSRERYSRMSPAHKARELHEFLNPDLKWKRLEQDRNRRFYGTRPYLIPQAGKNGLPPLPPKNFN